MKAMEEIVQLLRLPVLHLVVQTRFVRRVMDVLCASVILVSRVMDTTVQTSTSVQVRKQTNVTPMPCVPTVRDRMSVAVGKDMREMEDSVKLSHQAVLHLVVLTRCVRTAYAFVVMVTKVTDITAQTLMNAQAQKQMSVMPTPCAPTRKDPMFVAV